MGLRSPAVSGTFYPSDPARLREIIDRSLNSVPEPRGSPKDLRGLILPHAGYDYSLRIAAWGWKEVEIRGVPEVVVLLGPSHRGEGYLSTTSETFLTPLGSLEVDLLLHKRLIEGGLVVDDPLVHLPEHSLEVLLPPLQRLSERAHRPPPRIVPLLMGMQDKESARELAGELVRSLREEKRSILVIASSDLSHVGRSYLRDPPKGKRSSVWVEELDRRLLSALSEGSAPRLFSEVLRGDIPSCGHGPMGALLFLMEGKGKVKILRWGSSAEVEESENVVGYVAAGIFDEGSKG